MGACSHAHVCVRVGGGWGMTHRQVGQESTRAGCLVAEGGSGIGGAFDGQ